MHIAAANHRGNIYLVPAGYTVIQGDETKLEKVCKRLRVRYAVYRLDPLRGVFGIVVTKKSATKVQAELAKLEAKRLEAKRRQAPLLRFIDHTTQSPLHRIPRPGGQAVCDEELAFWDVIKQTRGRDDADWLVYADWLDEQDDQEAAQKIRTLLQARTAWNIARTEEFEAEDAQRKAIQADRRTAALKQLDELK